MNWRLRPGEAMLETGAADLRLVIGWLVENISSYGGDPGTIVVLANSEGATITAAYLFNEEWQRETGPNVAAAVLASGLFGSLAPGLERFVSEPVHSLLPHGAIVRAKGGKDRTGTVLRAIDRGLLG